MSAMSVPYQLVYSLLISEIVTLLLLSAPLPLVVRKHVIKFVSTSAIVEKGVYYLKVSMLGVLILFYDSARRTTDIQAEVLAHKISAKEGDSHHHHLSADQNAVLHSKLFYAQRNMYITGFTVLLAIVLNRVFSLQREVMKYKERSSVVVKQAENNSKQLAGLVDDKAKAEDELKALKEKFSEAEKLSKDSLLLKSQVKSNNDQYMELSDRYNALEARAKRVAEEHGIPLSSILGTEDKSKDKSDVRQRAAAGKKE